MSASSAVNGHVPMSSHKLRVIATDRARDDIGDILIYTEMQWGQEQRDEYWRLIAEAIDRLADLPGLGQIHDYMSSYVLRSVPVGSHRLYYWVDNDQLVIARVVHSRQDLQTIDWESLAGESGEKSDE